MKELWKSVKIRQRCHCSICCWALAPLLLGARRPHLSIDIFRSHGAQQQTGRTAAAEIVVEGFSRVLLRLLTPTYKSTLGVHYRTGSPLTGSAGSAGRWIPRSLGRWVTKCDSVPCLLCCRGSAAGAPGRVAAGDRPARQHGRRQPQRRQEEAVRMGPRARSRFHRPRFHQDAEGRRPEIAGQLSSCHCTPARRRNESVPKIIISDTVDLFFNCSRHFDNIKP